MVTASFVHLQGIGEASERALWEKGLRTWDDLEREAPVLFGPKKQLAVLRGIEESRVALESGRLGFFQSRLGNAHAWRLLPLCGADVAYFDIETTGTGFPPFCESTTVAVSFRGNLHVEHEPQPKRDLFTWLEAEAKMWVTFNGLCFDVPFLRRELGLALDQPHIDLRVWLRRHGFTGGLKRIQTLVPGVRARESFDIDGFDAVRLWRMHLGGVAGALETLMTYNAEDTVVLEELTSYAWERERERHAHLLLPERETPRPPRIETQVHMDVYRKLRGSVSPF